MIEITSVLNPAIFKSPTTGITYVVAGSQPWIEVPSGTTLDDIRWNPIIQPTQSASKAQEAVFHVEGTKNNKYTVKRSANGLWSCECLGFSFRRTCKHIKNCSREQ
jgi:hypothetical protein